MVSTDEKTPLVESLVQEANEDHLTYISENAPQSQPQVNNIRGESLVSFYEKQVKSGLNWENVTTGTWLDRHAPAPVPDSLRRTGHLCGGIQQDYKSRWPHIVSDFTDGFNKKTLSAGLFMFCATFASTVALGDVAERETDGKVGITEYLVLQGLAGMLHALFSGCPMPVLRPTGPITAFMVDLYLLSQNMNVDYYSLVAWVGMWTGFFLIIIACLDLSAYICLCTRFLHDIYAVFVCTIYISDGIIGVQERFDKTSFGAAFFQYYLALTVIIIALVLTYINFTSILTKRLRGIATDYAVVLAVLFAIAISYSTKSVDVDRLHLPRDFEPTINLYTDNDSNGRSWFQGPGGPFGVPFVALFASIPIVALFFFDQLFSCILGQKEELGIKKGQYYHSSFLLIGIFNFIFPLFGCPFVTASLPHSPQFVKALTEYDPITGKIDKVYENRVAPFLVYLLCFLALAVPSMLELCPEGVINGILTFVGVAGILPHTGNQFVDRVVLLFTHPSNFPIKEKYTQHVSWLKMHLFTCIQLVSLAACWGMRFTGDFALAFPLVVVLFVPLRLRLLPKIFSEEELEALDSEHSFSDTEETVDITPL